MAQQTQDLEKIWGGLADDDLPDLFQELPFLSVIVPTLNDDAFIKTTIESLIEQNYPHREIVVVDGGSSDQTLNILDGYKKQVDFVDYCQEKELYGRMNRGIEIAQGEYVTFLLPGGIYISYKSMAQVMVDAHKNHLPDLIYGGVLLRAKDLDPLVFNRSFSYPFLKKGKQPTGLEACFFKRGALVELGGFYEKYVVRGGYKLLCEFAEHASIRVVHFNRVLVDQKEIELSGKMLWLHFKETAQTIYHHFGLKAFASWFLVQNQLQRIFKLYMRKVRFALFGYR